MKQILKVWKNQKQQNYRTKYSEQCSRETLEYEKEELSS